MTTLGSQRMFALQHAANIIWPQLRSSVPVRIEVSFAERPCVATGAVLASAGALWIDLNFKRASIPDTWYHGALANKMATDLATNADEVRDIFNINLGQANCLAGSPFYYGLDGNEGAGWTSWQPHCTSSAMASVSRNSQVSLTVLYFSTCRMRITDISWTRAPA